ncbi:hypothetical protein [Advenella mimigardefordensis]|uniref:hypothetical protein n=1 Tax=Advenella mimigardefordensis TaxID=302406 RepID=UPI001181DC96|nr:hypothetical protein [Advenella mimigardefordensis]
MEYMIQSFEKVNEFKFGMTQEQVAQVSGPADEEYYDDYTKTMEETRADCILEYPDGGQLAAISILKKGKPVINGISVFEKGGFEKLCALEEPVSGIGEAYLLFRKLGLCLGGYAKKRIPEGKILIVFSKDRAAFYETFIDV